MAEVHFPYTRINPKVKNPAGLVQQNLEYYTVKANELIDGVSADVDTLTTDLNTAESNITALQAADTALDTRLDALEAAPFIASGFFPTLNAAVANVTLVTNQAYLIAMPIDGVGSLTLGTVIYTSSGSGSGMDSLDIGLYHSSDLSTFTRVASSGSFVSPASGNVNERSLTGTLTLQAGRKWFLAIACNGGGINIPGGGGAGVYTKTSSFPLPSSLTGMTAQAANGPYLVLRV